MRIKLYFLFDNYDLSKKGWTKSEDIDCFLCIYIYIFSAFFKEMSIKLYHFV